jgi:RsiW-degrading membrane proteinase PrsW (M82 family)
MEELLTLTYSLVAGILPALFWLWFWNKEDRLHPEPKGRLMACFLAGMAGAIVAIPLQRFATTFLGLDRSVMQVGLFIALAIPSTQIIIVFAWAAIEELVKYAGAAFFGIHSKDNDEPIDAMIYMISTALGFAALENTLFILNPMIDGKMLDGLATGNMRFLGASVVHVVSSAIIGYAIAHEFYDKVWKKVLWRIAGVIIAIGIHSAFNYAILFIANPATQPAFSIYGTDITILHIVFGCAWIVAILVMALFENVKHLSVQTTNP